MLEEKFMLEIDESVSLDTLDKVLDMIESVKETVQNNIQEDIVITNEREGRGQKNVGAVMAR